MILNERECWINLLGCAGENTVFFVQIKEIYLLMDGKVTPAHDIRS